MWPFGKQNDALDQTLANADLLFVRARLIEQFAGAILKKDVARSLDTFCNAPSLQSARALVDAEPRLLSLFAGSSESRRWYEMNGLPATEPRKNARMLSREPDFPALVESMLDDRVRHKALRDSFTAAGYSEDAISDAIGDYFKDLAE